MRSAVARVRAGERCPANVDIPRFQLHTEADIASLLFQHGAGRAPCTNGDGGKEPYCCGKQTPIFLRGVRMCFGAIPENLRSRGFRARRQRIRTVVDRDAHRVRPNAKVVLRHSSFTE